MPNDVINCFSIRIVLVEIVPFCAWVIILKHRTTITIDITEQTNIFAMKGTIGLIIWREVIMSLEAMKQACCRDRSIMTLLTLNQLYVNNGAKLFTAEFSSIALSSLISIFKQKRQPINGQMN